MQPDTERTVIFTENEIRNNQAKATILPTQCTFPGVAEATDYGEQEKPGGPLFVQRTKNGLILFWELF